MNRVDLLMVAGLGLAVFLNSLWWSSAIPFDGAPDEYLHYKIPLFYIQNHRLPVFLKDEGMARTCRANGIDCGASYSPYANYGYFINAATMLFLGEGHTNGRVGSALMAVVFILLVYLTSKAMFSKDRLTAWVVVLVSATVPMFTFVSAYINSDIAGMVSSTLVLYFCWRLLFDPEVKTGLLIMGGLAIGLLALSRYNQYPTFFLVPWVLWLRKRRDRESWGKVIWKVAVVGGIGLAMSGWWFVRNWYLYGDPTGNSVLWKFWWTFSTRQTPMQMGISPLTFIFGQIYGKNWLVTSFESFIGSFGYMTVWFPKWFYVVIGSLSLASVIGLRRYIQKWIKAKSYEGWFWMGSLIVSMSAVLLSAWSSWVNEFQPQGRYLFAGYYPFVVMVVFGLMHLSERKEWKLFSATLSMGLFLIANIWGRTLIGVAG